MKKFSCFIGDNNAGKSAVQEAILSIMNNSLIGSDKVCRNNQSHVRVEYSIKLDDYDIQKVQDYLSDKYGVEFISEFLLSADKSGIFNDVIYFQNRIVDKEYPSSLGEPLNRFFLGKYIQENLVYPTKLEDYLRDIALKIDEDKYSNLGSDISDFLLNYIRNNVVQISARRILTVEKTESPLQQTHKFNGNNVKRILHNSKNSKQKLMFDRFKRFQKIVSSWSFSPGIPDIAAVAGGDISIIFRKEDGTSILIDELGDGLKEAVIIAAICILYPEKIYLIEEPELHLHPKAVRELRTLFKNEVLGQVIISTHNPVFINEIDINTAIFKTIQKDGITKAYTLQNIKDLIEFKTDFDLRNSDFFFYDAIVFVEGFTDYSVFDIWYKKLFGSEKFILFLRAGGYREIKPSLFLSIMLQMNQAFSIITIIDKDDRNPEDVRNGILNSIKRKEPKIYEKIDKESLKNSIIILKRRNLEEYFSKASVVISQYWDLNTDEIQNLFENNRGKISESLENFASIKGKQFSKSRELPIWAEMMEQEDIDEEIISIFTQINRMIEGK